MSVCLLMLDTASTTTTAVQEDGRVPRVAAALLEVQGFLVSLVEVEEQVILEDLLLPHPLRSVLEVCFVGWLIGCCSPVREGREAAQFLSCGPVCILCCLFFLLCVLVSQYVPMLNLTLFSSSFSSSLFLSDVSARGDSGSTKHRSSSFGFSSSTRFPVISTPPDPLSAAPLCCLPSPNSAHGYVGMSSLSSPASSPSSRSGSMLSSSKRTAGGGGGSGVTSFRSSYLRDNSSSSNKDTSSSLIHQRSSSGELIRPPSKVGAHAVDALSSLLSKGLDLGQGNNNLNFHSFRLLLHLLCC